MRRYMMLALLASGLLSSVAYAAPTEHYLQKAQQLKLAQDQTWQRLLYLKDGHSQVKNTSFFLTKNSEALAEAELHAQIAGLFTYAADDQSVQCRFPARSRWLIEKLQIPQDALAQVTCSSFTAWLDNIAPQSATLVYATDFMGNPSSMFGHTLLRINPKTEDDLDLMAYAVNYAATVQGEDGVRFAWRGLTGQYPGEYSILPYYRKVKEYSDFESRDLWEYQLNLSAAQTEFMLQHLWEMQKVQFNYYFISDNCAYRLLGLIDLVVPEANLQRQFKTTAIPIETIKALKQRGLVTRSEYRPALETQLLHQVRQHGQTLARYAQQLTLVPAEQLPSLLNAYSIEDQAKLLEMAYDALYLKLVAGEVKGELAQPRLRQLLVQRSQLDIQRQRQDPPKPKYDPIDGHHARKIQLTWGYTQKQNVLEISQRSAYHDLIDPIAGFRIGTQLNSLDWVAQYRDHHWKLKQFTLFNVNAYNPITEFKSDLSWGFDLGWYQQAIDSDGQFSSTQQHGVMDLKTQVGYSWADLSRQHLCYAQFQTQIQLGKALDLGWRSGVGPILGCQNLWTSRIQSVLQAELPYWDDQQQWQLKLNAQVQYSFSANHAMRLKYEYEQQDSQHWQGIHLGYSWFY